MGRQHREKASVLSEPMRNMSEWLIAQEKFNGRQLTFEERALILLYHRDTAVRALVDEAQYKSGKARSMKNIAVVFCACQTLPGIVAGTMIGLSTLCFLHEDHEPQDNRCTLGLNIDYKYYTLMGVLYIAVSIILFAITSYLIYKALVGMGKYFERHYTKKAQRQIDVEVVRKLVDNIFRTLEQIRDQETQGYFLHKIKSLYKSSTNPEHHQEWKAVKGHIRLILGRSKARIQESPQSSHSISHSLHESSQGSPRMQEDTRLLAKAKGPATSSNSMQEMPAVASEVATTSSAAAAAAAASGHGYIEVPNRELIEELIFHVHTKFQKKDILHHFDTHPNLRLAFNTFRGKIEDVFIGAKAASLIAKPQEGGMARFIMPIEFTGDVLHLTLGELGKVMEMGMKWILAKPMEHIDGARQKNTAEHISGLVPSLKQVMEIAESVAIQLTQWYAPQLEKLATKEEMPRLTHALVKAKDKLEEALIKAEKHPPAKQFAEYCILLMLESLRDFAKINDDEPLDKQLVRIVTTYNVGMLGRLINSIAAKLYMNTVKTSEGRDWLSLGIITNSGIKTKEGKRYAGKGTNPDEYGYCAGTEEVAHARGLELVDCELQVLSGVTGVVESDTGSEPEEEAKPLVSKRERQASERKSSEAQGDPGAASSSAAASSSTTLEQQRANYSVQAGDPITFFGGSAKRAQQQAQQASVASTALSPSFPE